jgi:hypothetical protein
MQSRSEPLSPSPPTFFLSSPPPPTPPAPTAARLCKVRETDSRWLSKASYPLSVLCTSLSVYVCEFVIHIRSNQNTETHTTDGQHFQKYMNQASISRERERERERGRGWVYFFCPLKCFRSKCFRSTVALDSLPRLFWADFRWDWGGSAPSAGSSRSQIQPAWKSGSREVCRQCPALARLNLSYNGYNYSYDGMGAVGSGKLRASWLGPASGLLL